MPVGLLITAVLSLMLLLTGCEKSEPIRIGFIAGLSGKVSDLGQAGRNGVLLAVEEINEAGGINGRPIELLIRDDEQDKEVAIKAVKELIDEGVEAIIGPMTSSMAMVQKDIANAHEILMISPTATSIQLSSQDDFFFRVIDSTRAYSRFTADFMTDELNLKKAAAVYDARNLAYTEAWLDDFEARFNELGGSVVRRVAFNSAENTDHLQVINEMLAGEPEVLLFISSAVDTARFVQVARQVAPEIRYSSVEWSATESLIELGGNAVNGLTLTQYFNREDQSANYQRYKSAYQERYQRAPGFADVAAYDASQALFKALQSRQSGQDLKQALLSATDIPALQNPIVFDEFGDSTRRVYMTQIENGEYRIVR